MTKYSVILGNLGNTCDRFLSSGYKNQSSKAARFRQAASIPGVKGVELVGTWDVSCDNVKAVRKQLQTNRLKCVSIIPDHFSRKVWGQGAFTSRKASIRKQAVGHTKEMMDIAVELGCPLINLWPGQDGYDYPLQGNFSEARDQFVSGVRECAAHNPDVRISLEYKVKEPRTHSYLARAADTLLLAQETGCDTVGVTIDTGHSMMAQENVAEAAVLLLRAGKLFHVHFNDNYTAWDDDMIVGSIHHVLYIELLYWLRRMKYDGWYSMDQYPYREDARDALAESVAWLKGFEKIIDRYGENKLAQLIAEGSATKISEAVRKMLLPRTAR